MVKRFFSLAVCLFVTLSLAGCGLSSSDGGSSSSIQQEKYTATWFDVFDTVTTVVGYAESQEEWDRQMQALHEDLQTYHKYYDIYNSYEGITNLRDVNLQAGQAPVQVEPIIMDLLVLSKEMNTLTQGKLNIALGSVLKIWHDYRTAGLDEPETAQLPPMELLQEANQHTHLEDLVLDTQAQTVFFADPELQLDVGSVGKGYAVEQVALAAQQRGLKSALISVGGNLRSIGRKPDGTLWSGGVQDPWASVGQTLNQSAYLAAVELENQALVISGDYQRFYTVEGQRYHHLIDPDTLMPANLYSAVAVLAGDSGLADCLSTGLFCLPLEEGQALVRQLEGVEAMWMLPDGSIVYSDHFLDHTKSTK